jgi:hypothetical protein
MAATHAYIEARLRDIFAACRAAAPWDEAAHARFEEVVRLIAAIGHYRAYSALQGLRDLYDPLDPDRAGPRAGASAPAFAAFEAALERVLIAGNFEETPFETLGRNAQAHALNDLRIKASAAGVRRVRVFARGGHGERHERRVWFGLRKEEIDAEILDEVVFLVAFRDEAEIARRDARALARMRRGVRPGSVLVKLFANVARHELAALHPGAKPAMRTRDQLYLGVPALAGAVPLVLQIGPAVSVIFALIAGYFTVGAIIDDSALKRALAAVSGIVALGAFIMRQWMKYERQALKYQKRLADMVYYRNLANNHGVLATLISAAEEQDVKEAALGYWALLAAQGPLTKAEIDKAAETLLRERCDRVVDFEIADALDKLEALALIEREGDSYRAVPPDEALSRLDAAWDNLFHYAKTDTVKAELD